MRKRTVLLIAALFIVAAAPQRALAAPQRSPCVRANVDRAAIELRDIENDRDDSMQGVAHRSAALATIAGEGSDLVRDLRACRTDAPTAARIDTLVVWARLIALRATQAAVYPKPYRDACHAYDVSALQVAFIEAWTARLATQDGRIARADLWSALGREPLYDHVALLARTTAHRLGVRDLPTFDSDEARWLADNRDRPKRLPRSSPPGRPADPKSRCGACRPLRPRPRS